MITALRMMTALLNFDDVEERTSPLFDGSFIVFNIPLIFLSQKEITFRHVLKRNTNLGRLSSVFPVGLNHLTSKSIRVWRKALAVCSCISNVLNYIRRANPPGRLPFHDKTLKIWILFFCPVDIGHMFAVFFIFKNEKHFLHVVRQISALSTNLTN